MRLCVARMARRTFGSKVAALGLATLAVMLTAASANSPTPEEYLAHVPTAKMVKPGDPIIDDLKLQCGRRPTILDDKLDDYGAAYPGFLILNPKLMSKVTPAVKRWIYAHECGHQFRGPDEETADCFAVQRGRRQGWLTTEGLEEVCRFISPAKGDSMHFSGSHRCEAMRRCYGDPTVK